MIVNAYTLCDIYGVTRRTLTNWLNSRPPCPSTLEDGERMFDTAAVARWRETRAADQAIARLDSQDPSGVVALERRKLYAEVRTAEMKADREEARLVPVDVVDQTVGEMADRLRAVCINAPANYGVDLERAGVTPDVAQEVLERIAEDLVRALRDEAQEYQLEDDGDADDDG